MQLSSHDEKGPDWPPFDPCPVSEAHCFLEKTSETRVTLFPPPSWIQLQTVFPFGTELWQTL
jgi:hypothetical protein